MTRDKPMLKHACLKQSLQRIGCLAVAFIFSTCSFAAENSEEAQQQLEAVSAAIGNIETWLGEAAERYSAEQESLRDTELALAEVNQSISTLTADVEIQRSELVDLQARQSALNDLLIEQSDTLSEIIRATYISGDDGFLKTLLNQEDASEADRMLHYARVLSDYQQAQIAAYKANLNELDEVTADLTNSLEALNSQQRALESEQQELNKLKAERASALAALNSDISSRSAELEQLEVNRAELETLLQEIARAMEGIRSFEDIPALQERRGQLPRPLDGPVISRFGASYGGGSLTRQGIVIGAAEGSPVLAVHPGYVAFANWLRGSGLLIVLDHGDGYVSLYGGNQALAVEAGEWVDTGTVIATSGLGGVAQEPGLYFELRYQGNAQNPDGWFAR